MTRPYNFAVYYFNLEAVERVIAPPPVEGGR